MSDLEKRWDTKLPQSVSMHVLRRSLETTAGFYRLNQSQHQAHWARSGHLTYERQSTSGAGNSHSS